MIDPVFHRFSSGFGEISLLTESKPRGLVIGGRQASRLIPLLGAMSAAMLIGKDAIAACSPSQTAFGCVDIGDGGCWAANKSGPCPVT